MRVLEITRHRQMQFWTLNLFGWLGYSFFVLLSALLWDKDPALQLPYTALAGLSGLLVSMAQREIFQRIWDYPPAKRGLISLLIVGATTSVWSLIKMYVFIWMYPGEMEIRSVPAEFIGWFTYSFFILLSWAALYYGIKFYQLTQVQKDKLLKITAMAHQAQLKMLRYQLNPHFLFNTLNAISTLILDNRKDVANNMVTHLSRFLRYSLDSDPMQKITLEQEVDALILYLDIEKIRFDDRLTLEFCVEKKAAQALIPSLLLQPLVENSIKYAVARSESGGTIRLEAKVLGDELLLILSDNGPGISFEGSQWPKLKGVGINNTCERLQELYGSSQSCHFSAAEPHGLKVTIRLPYQTHMQNTSVQGYPTA